MTKTNKTLIALLLAAVMTVSLLALVACGGKVIESIEITTAPTKTDYIAGETFDPTGMVVSVVYEGGKTSVLSSDEYTYSPTGELTTGTRNITITYEKDGQLYKAMQPVTVHNAIVSAVLKSEPDKKEYMVGERFDPTGMVVTATYENGDVKDIDITKDNATFKTEALTDTDTVITVTYQGHDFKIEIEIIAGVFIEAEDGIINSSAYEIKDDAVDHEGHNTATGDHYVGNMFSNDSITFVFNSDKEGTGDIAFRLASLYLKKDDGNWSPIWMGDCQFNKICKFSVNGVEYAIDDSVILPGGGSEDGEVDYTLWTNWKEVEFTDIHFRAGRNDITLTFIPHDYTDTAQASFSGSFTANIDSLKVKSLECEVTPCKLSIDSIDTTAASLVEADDTVYLKLEGDIAYTGYYVDEVVARLEKEVFFSLTMNGADYATSSSLRTATVDGDKFTLLVDISLLTTGNYTVYFHEDNGSPLALTLGAAAQDGQTASYSYKKYTLSSKTDASADEDFKGNLGIIVAADGEVTTYEGTGAKLELREGAPYLVVTGTVQHTFTDMDQAAIALNDMLGFEIQDNGGSWTYRLSTSADRKVTVKADGTFEIAINISSLSTGKYITHMGPEINGGTGHYADFTISGDAAPNGLTITAGSKKYTLISGNSDYFNCVGILIESSKNYSVTGATLEAKNSKPYLVVTGKYEGFTATELEKEFANIYADILNIPDYSSVNKDWTEVAVLVKGDTIIIEIAADGTFKIYLDLTGDVVADGWALFAHLHIPGTNKGNNFTCNNVDLSASITVGGFTYTFKDTTNTGDWKTNLVVVMVTAA